VIDTTELLHTIKTLSGGPVDTLARHGRWRPATRCTGARRRRTGSPPNGAGQRVLELTVGPLPDDPAQADNLVELFKEITDLGTIEPLDAGRRRRHAPLQGHHHQQRRRPAGPVHLPRRRASRCAWRRWAGLRLPRRRAGRRRPEERPPDRATASSTTPRARPGSGRRQRRPRQLPVHPGRGGGRRRQARPAAEGRSPRPAPARLGTLRVSVEKVDQLINLVGELVITQAMLAQNSKGPGRRLYQQMAGLADLERNTRDLQEAVMSIRMIPMSMVFNRFPRMLRDLAAKLGKKVELVTVGEATELDKGLVEKITDPLTHLVRNSCDHGIELPAERSPRASPSTAPSRWWPATRAAASSSRCATTARA
jgi:two-component system chemotaxis sensor kinase CheA